MKRDTAEAVASGCMGCGIALLALSPYFIIGGAIVLGAWLVS